MEQVVEADQKCQGWSAITTATLQLKRLFWSMNGGCGCSAMCHIQLQAYGFEQQMSNDKQHAPYYLDGPDHYLTLCFN